MPDSELCEFDGRLYAIIVRANFREDGVHFVTPDDAPQQVGHHYYARGKVILPHAHQPLDVNVRRFQEVLVIKSGKLAVDFYGDDRRTVGSRLLSAGDVIVLCEGGHGFTVIEDLAMIEIKQGPFLGEAAVARFEPAGISA